MYQPYETETWGELRGELRHEAELRARRTLAKRAQRKASFASAMRRRAALLLSTLGLALIMAAGAAYAMDVIQCGPSHATPCLGTEAPDVMNGTVGVDHIVGLDDTDEIHGLASLLGAPGGNPGGLTPEPQATGLTSVPSGRYTGLRAGSQGIDFDTRGRFAGRRAGSGRGGRLGDDARSRGARGGGEQGRSALPLPEQGGFDRGHDPAPHRGLR